MVVLIVFLFQYFLVFQHYLFPSHAYAPNQRPLAKMADTSVCGLVTWNKHLRGPPLGSNSKSAYLPTKPMNYYFRPESTRIWHSSYCLQWLVSQI